MMPHLDGFPESYWAFEQEEYTYWMNATFEKALSPIVNRIYNLLMRSVVRDSDDSQPTQGVTVEYAEGKLFPNCERLQPYGFSSVPLPGSLGLMQGQGGHTDAAIITLIDDQRFRIHNLQPGEIAFYTHKDSEPHGHRIVFKNDGSIEVFAKSIKFTAEDDLELTAGRDVKINARNDLTVTIGDTAKIDVAGRFDLRGAPIVVQTDGSAAS